MSAEFDRFTDEDRKQLAALFGKPFYSSTAEHADAYVKSKYKKEDQEINYGEDRDWISSQDVTEVNTPEIHMERFLEDYFRKPKTSERVLNGMQTLRHFYKWKKAKQEDYYKVNSSASNEAAEIIGELNIHDVYEYTSAKAEIYAGKAFYTPRQAVDREFHVQKAQEWNYYRRAINAAVIVELRRVRK